ncbi:paxillin isoform X2 [Lepus europaeus]|uniref:paxillin isoform X2 n=1 Tax=Lepus europaeus TaxID=9983 RepID=UPI002B47B403|nr:paxillin isoform X2 [Lepus europaeus]
MRPMDGKPRKASFGVWMFFKGQSPGFSFAATWVSVNGGSQSLRPSPPLAGNILPHFSPFLSPLPSAFVFLLLQTSSSTVALSSLGPSSAPSSHHTLPPTPSPPPVPSAARSSFPGQGHTQEVLCTEQHGRGHLPPGAPSWLDLAGLGVTPDSPNSRSPSAEGSLGPFGAENQVQVRRDLLKPTHELCVALPCHTPPTARSTGSLESGDPQGPLVNPVCPEKATDATWAWPWALEMSRPKTTRGAACSFQAVTEPAVVAVDRQAVFPDTWSLTEECGQQKQRVRTQPRGLGSSCPPPVDEEQLGGKVPKWVSLVGPSQEPETPRIPKGTTGETAEASKDQSELPHATVLGTPSATERISTSGQIRSVIRRSRETGHAHPMSREPSPRRRLDPATLSRTPSQERLIAELQGRLGIQPEAEEAAGAPAQDWLTEGIVITVQPRGRQAGGQLVEKIQGLEQRVDGELCWAASWPPNGRQSSPEGQDEGGVSDRAGHLVFSLLYSPGWCSLVPSAL